MTEQEVYNIAREQAQKVKKFYDENRPSYAGFDPEELAIVATSIAKVESGDYKAIKTNLNEKAYNKSTASGLMQIKTPYVKDDIEKRILRVPVTSASTIFEPEYNLYLGIAFLAYQYQRYGFNTDKMVTAYHLGSYKVTTDGKEYLRRYKIARENFTNHHNLKTSQTTNIAKAGMTNWIIGGILVSVLLGTYFMTRNK